MDQSVERLLHEEIYLENKFQNDPRPCLNNKLMIIIKLTDIKTRSSSLFNLRFIANVLLIRCQAI